ncbi:hypothetical protein CIHG_00669 [Coccidioides immitis H538.4]|uniref:Uncharacterized protein n=1 Tax=Coccidioides immitis H538.4 TaxID=396776 RepID=A0A0J8RE74_COCIT|nr:hypothetical protein CIHG_00669 [Coccidioides immitis H538.4]
MHLEVYVLQSSSKRSGWEQCSPASPGPYGVNGEETVVSLGNQLKNGSLSSLLEGTSREEDSHPGRGDAAGRHNHLKLVTARRSCSYPPRRAIAASPRSSPFFVSSFPTWKAVQVQGLRRAVSAAAAIPHGMRSISVAASHTVKTCTANRKHKVFYEPPAMTYFSSQVRMARELRSQDTERRKGPIARRESRSVATSGLGKESRERCLRISPSFAPLCGNELIVGVLPTTSLLKHRSFVLSALRTVPSHAPHYLSSRNLLPGQNSLPLPLARATIPLPRSGDCERGGQRRKYTVTVVYLKYPAPAVKATSNNRASEKVFFISPARHFPFRLSFPFLGELRFLAARNFQPRKWLTQPMCHLERRSGQEAMTACRQDFIPPASRCSGWARGLCSGIRFCCSQNWLGRCPAVKLIRARRFRGYRRRGLGEPVFHDIPQVSHTGGDSQISSGTPESVSRFASSFSRWLRQNPFGLPPSLDSRRSSYSAISFEPDTWDPKFGVWRQDKLPERSVRDGYLVYVDMKGKKWQAQEAEIARVLNYEVRSPVCLNLFLGRCLESNSTSSPFRSEGAMIRGLNRFTPSSWLPKGLCQSTGYLTYLRTFGGWNHLASNFKCSSCESPFKRDPMYPCADQPMAQPSAACAHKTLKQSYPGGHPKDARRIHVFILPFSLNTLQRKSSSPWEYPVLNR